jgi:hypothetical protein
MPRPSGALLTALALAAAAGACDRRGAFDATATAPVRLTLHRASSAISAAWTSGGALFQHGDSGRHRGDWASRLALAGVDSIIVVVSEVQLAPARHDTVDDDEEDGDGSGSASMGRPGPRGDMGGRHGRPGWPGRDSAAGRGDSLRHRGDSARHRGGAFDHDAWISLQVVSGGRVDLLNLPTEDAQGIVLATGDVPPGDYHLVRLVIASGEIWLNTELVTPHGDTLPANTAIPVFFPSGGVMILTDFTVPEGGGDVALVFDADETFAHVVITGDGRVMVTPVLHHRPGPMNP